VSSTDVVSAIVSMISSDFVELVVIIGGLAGITVVVRLLLGALSFGGDRLA